jgi:hypothetical protein
MNTDHIVNKLTELKTNYLDTAKQMFTDGAAELFNLHPKLDSFGFKAYSPYFNDGDECRFNIHADIDYGLYINGFDNDGEEAFESRENDVNVWDKHTHWDCSNGYQNRVEVKGDPEIDAMIKSVHDFIYSFDEDIWEELIGNHVVVRISRDGIETNEYTNHD